MELYQILFFKRSDSYLILRSDYLKWTSWLEAEKIAFDSKNLSSKENHLLLNHFLSENHFLTDKLYQMGPKGGKREAK
jgi:hypothetical protein